MGAGVITTGLGEVDSVKSRRWVGAGGYVKGEGIAFSDGNEVKAGGRGVAGHGLKAGGRMY